MSKLPFSREFAFEVVEEYLLHTMDILWCVTNYDHLKKAKEQLLVHRDGSILDTVFTYAETGIWKGPAPEEVLPMFMDLFEMNMPEYLNYGDHDRRDKLAPLVNMLETRFQIDPFDGVVMSAGCDGCADYSSLDFSDPDNYFYLISRGSLALLEGKTEETIRAAMYLEEDQALKPVRDDLYSPVDVKRWQIANGTFQPSLYYRQVEFEPDHGFSDLNSFRRWIRGFGEKQQTGITARLEDIQMLLPSHAQAAFADFCNADDEAVSWFTVDVAVKISELLRVSPRWLAESVFKIFDPVVRKQQINKTMPSSEFFKEKLALQSAASLADETSATPENLIALLTCCEWLQTHPLQRKATAKISGYLTASGVTVLHEFNLKKQYIWLPKERGESLRLSKKLYPSSNLGKGGSYGRNSAIKKFDAIAYADLYRIQIEKCGDLRQVLDQLK